MRSVKGSGSTVTRLVFLGKAAVAVIGRTDGRGGILGREFLMMKAKDDEGLIKFLER